VDDESACGRDERSSQYVVDDSAVWIAPASPRKAEYNKA